MIPNPLPDTASSLYVRKYFLQATIGQLGTSSMLQHKKSMLNEDPQAVKVDNVTLDAGFVVDKVYAISILGFTTSYTTVAGDVDVDGVAASFAAKINSNPDIRARVEAAATGAGGVMTLTGLQPNDDFVVIDVTNTVTVNAASPESAAAIPFARLVLFKGYSSTPHRAANELCRLATSAAFTAQSDTVTVDTFDGASTYLVSIVTDSGYRADFAVPGNTDEPTTAADIEAAINADLVLASEGITADDSAGGGELSIDSANAGYGFITTVSVLGGAGAMSLVADDRNATSLLAAAEGVAFHKYDGEQAYRGDGSVVYEPNEPVKVLTEGSVWVELDAADSAPTKGAPVYVDLTPGDTAGRFYVDPGAGRVKLAGLSWLRGANNGSDLIAEMRVRLFK
jgi:hypothetical protein